MNLDMFDPQVEALSEEHTLVRMDFRGYGESSVPVLESYLDCVDIAAVPDALAIDCAVLGGNPFGRAVTFDFAFARPDRVAGLVLDAATVFAGWEWQEEFPFMVIL